MHRETNFRGWKRAPTDHPGGGQPQPVGLTVGIIQQESEPYQCCAANGSNLRTAKRILALMRVVPLPFQSRLQGNGLGAML